MNDIILFVLTVIVGIIGYFLMQFHRDHKKNIANVALMKIDLLKNTFTNEATERLIESYKTLIDQKMDTIIRDVNRQTTAVEDMQKTIIHLDKNTSGIKIFFDKYMKIEDKQNEFELLLTHIQERQISNESRITNLERK